MRIQKNDEYDEYIKSKLFILRKNKNTNNFNIRLNTNWKILMGNELYDYLNNCFDDSLSIKESLYRIYYNIDEHPTCIYCNNLSKFDICEETLFRKYCYNKECYIKYGIEKAKITKLKKYGDENYNNRPKMKQTKLERYGDENYTNSSLMKKTKLEKYEDENYVNPNKAKQTKLEKYGDETFNNINKAQQTCLEKYGVEYVLSKNSSIREKIKQANIDKYGFYYVNFKKAKQTKLEKYGDENYNNRERAKQTCLERYGVESIMHLQEVVKKIANSEIRKQHEIETKRKNKSFNKSIVEDESYNLLKEKYHNVIRQYRSKLYPFNCDFYIPNYNDNKIDSGLYIECNYSWTHCNHPFNEHNKEDQLIVKSWKEKNTQYYDNAINTWTIRDVNKRNIAKQNNLNYIEFWNIGELKHWLQI